MMKTSSTLLLESQDPTKSWDFTSIVESNSGDNDTLSFSTPSGAPSGLNSNLSITIEDETVYLNKSETGLDILSFPSESEGGIEISVTNPLSMIPYPLSMGTVKTDDFVIGVSISDTESLPSGSLDTDIQQSGSNEFTVDACGSITTPKGTFQCLRYIVTPDIPEYEVSVSMNVGGIVTNIPLSPSEIDNMTIGKDFNMFEGKTYVWISKDHGYPLAQVVEDSNGDIVSVEYLK